MHWEVVDVVERVLMADWMVVYWAPDLATVRQPEGGLVRDVARAQRARVVVTRERVAMRDFIMTGWAHGEDDVGVGQIPGRVAMQSYIDQRWQPRCISHFLNPGKLNMSSKEFPRTALPVDGRCLHVQRRIGGLRDMCSIAGALVCGEDRRRRI